MLAALAAWADLAWQVQICTNICLKAKDLSRPLYVVDTLWFLALTPAPRLLPFRAGAAGFRLNGAVGGGGQLALKSSCCYRDCNSLSIRYLDSVFIRAQRYKSVNFKCKTWICNCTFFSTPSSVGFLFLSSLEFNILFAVSAERTGLRRHVENAKSQMGIITGRIASLMQKSLEKSKTDYNKFDTQTKMWKIFFTFIITNIIQYYLFHFLEFFLRKIFVKLSLRGANELLSLRG